MTQSATVNSVFAAQVARLGDQAAMRELTRGGAARDGVVSWRQWSALSHSVAAALVAGGFAKGARVAILAGNRPLWPVADIGIILAGLVSVGVYPTSAPAQLCDLLDDCGASVLLVDTGEQLAKVLGVVHDLPRLTTIICEDDEAVHGARAARNGDGPAPQLLTWSEWTTAGEVALEDRGLATDMAGRINGAASDDAAAIIYTSGSTGAPKGAVLSHRYLLESAASIRDTLGVTGDDTTVSFLPFCHAAERVSGLYLRVLTGMEAAMVKDPARVWDVARAINPTLFGGLPRFYEKAYEALVSWHHSLRAHERIHWDETLSLGRQRAALRRAGSDVPEAMEKRWRMAVHAASQVLHGFFGTRIRLATSGGAALPFEVAEYLDACGLTVLGAYGQTEHLCIAFNRPEHYRHDAVGTPMPGTTLRLADDGEILVRRNALTFTGYHGRPVATDEAFSRDGEWLHTGDLGELLDDGSLRIVGRKKELIALSTGKKVAPLPIEAQLREDPLISHAMLYGEGRKFITALLTLSRPMVDGWKKTAGVDAPYEELMAHPALLARVQTAIDRVNALLSRTEQVRRFVVVAEELSVSNDELTPTFKLRRDVVVERYRASFDALYAENA